MPSKKPKIIKGILIDTTKPKNEIKEHDFEQVKDATENLHNIYKMLNCDCIDVVERKFGKNVYDIYCDDEALLKGGTPILAIATYNQNNVLVEQIVGNVFICKHDGQGGMQALTPKECSEILNEILAYISVDGDVRFGLKATV